MKEKDYLEELEETNKEVTKSYIEGVGRLERGNLDEAEEIFIKIKDEEPSFVPTYNKLAIISIYRKDMAGARQLLEKALQLDNEFAPALTNLGSIIKEEGTREEAKKYYQKAIEIDPDYGPAYNNLGVIYKEEGNISESVKNLKKANKLKSYSVAYQDRPFYKEPGCLIPTLIIIGVLAVIYILFK